MGLAPNVILSQSSQVKNFETSKIGTPKNLEGHIEVQRNIVALVESFSIICGMRACISSNS
jgi:hypothetical protein